MLSLCIKTLQRAIANRNLLSWPVEHLKFTKLQKTTEATEKDHIDQEMKNLNYNYIQNTNNTDKFQTKKTIEQIIYL